MPDKGLEEVDLIGPGPFVLPVVEGVIGLDQIDDQGPPEMVFILRGGTELRLPIRGIALADLWNQLGQLLQDAF